MPDPGFSERIAIRGLADQNLAAKQLIEGLVGRVGTSSFSIRRRSLQSTLRHLTFRLRTQSDPIWRAKTKYEPKFAFPFRPRNEWQEMTRTNPKPRSEFKSDQLFMRRGAKSQILGAKSQNLARDDNAKPLYRRRSFC
jgi:hypothetical protein